MSKQGFSAWLSKNKLFLYRIGIGLVLLPIMIVLGLVLFSLLSMVASIVLFLVVAILVLGFALMIVSVIEDKILAKQKPQDQQPDTDKTEVEVIDVITLP